MRVSFHFTRYSVRLRSFFPACFIFFVLGVFSLRRNNASTMYSFSPLMIIGAGDGTVPPGCCLYTFSNDARNTLWTCIVPGRSSLNVTGSIFFVISNGPQKCGMRLIYPPWCNLMYFVESHTSWPTLKGTAYVRLFAVCCIIRCLAACSMSFVRFIAHIMGCMNAMASGVSGMIRRVFEIAFAVALALIMCSGVDNDMLLHVIFVSFAIIGCLGCTP
jgi:hypothetical protein